MRKRRTEGDIQLLLSGDLSFSFQPLVGDLSHHKKLYKKSLQNLIAEQATKHWILIFSRKNNFGPEKV